ncbi:MAG: M23 family metallopeptidase [Pseudomonadota bacterium]
MLRPPGHHPFAMDFVRTDHRGRMHDPVRGVPGLRSIDAARYHCWDQPVFAPFAGEVLHSAGDWPDHAGTSAWATVQRWYEATFRFKPVRTEGFIDIRPNAGNYVMIRGHDGVIAFLAHLREGSPCVVPGDRVALGAPVGRVGLSGNTTAPHLHFNLFDQMDDPFEAAVLPFVIDSFAQRSRQGAWERKIAATPDVGAWVAFDVSLPDSSEQGRLSSEPG